MALPRLASGPVLGIALAVGLVIASVIAIPRFWRPLFANTYGLHEFAILPRWQDQFADAHDKTGNFVLLDYRCNLVLVVLLADQRRNGSPNEGFQKSYPLVAQLRKSATRSSILVTVTPNGAPIKISRCTNRLFIVLPDASILESQLSRYQTRPINVPSEEYSEDILRLVEVLVRDDPGSAALVTQARRYLQEYEDSDQKRADR